MTRLLSVALVALAATVLGLVPVDAEAGIAGICTKEADQNGNVTRTTFDLYSDDYCRRSLGARRPTGRNRHFGGCANAKSGPGREPDGRGDRNRERHPGGLRVRGVPKP